MEEEPHEHEFEIAGDKYIFWQGPRIGTCGDPVDTLRLSVGRVRAIPDLIVGFDGERHGWVISGCFKNREDTDFEYVEVAFVPEDDLEDNRFCNPT